jgi:LmbE family N-acetylglucosaminyl deacetylase
MRIVLPRTRTLARLACLLLVMAATEAGAFFYGVHQENRRLQSLALPQVAAPALGESVLVLAPHCDDETLGAGGLIRAAVRAGARVRVAFLTNGDGFPLAASRRYGKIRLTRDTYIRFAYHRQAEAIAALRELGVARDQVTFLGYPDGGLAPMWTRYWDEGRPYRSRFTRSTANPYRNSLRPNAPYCGRSVLEDVKRLLRQERPTTLVVPHPGDDHPDHWASYCYLTAALREIALEEQPGPWIGAFDHWAQRARVQTYLVHRGDWPVPQGLERDARLVPPAALVALDTEWSTLPLDAETRAAKERALWRYRSQMAVMRRFLQSFVRSDELFGALSPVALPLSPGPLVAGWPPAPNDGRLETVIADCARDTFIRDLSGSGDLQAVAALTDGRSLRLRLTARSAVSPRVRYRLRLQPLGPRDPNRVTAPLTVTFSRGKSDTPGVRCVSSGRRLEVVAPLALLGYPREILIGADTEFTRLVVDRVCWRTVRLPDPLPMISAAQHRP